MKSPITIQADVHTVCFLMEDELVEILHSKRAKLRFRTNTGRPDRLCIGSMTSTNPDPSSRTQKISTSCMKQSG